MFKVLIIDDEPIIRKGLKNIIHWKQFNCEICGEAADGLEGRELIKKHVPDIIITDIRMPEVDGLTMIREIKDMVPGVKIIILTGYRNFDYVHEAIRLGAFDFLLKPSKIEELTAVINRAVKELKFQCDRTEEFNKLKRLFEQNIPVLREKFLYDIIYELNTDESEILAKMELFNMKIDSFKLVVVEDDGADDEENSVNQYDKHLYQFGIINTFEEIFSDIFQVINISLSNKRVAFILQNPNKKEEVSNTINDKSAQLQEIIKNCFGFTVTIAISSEGTGPPQLPQKLKECHDALEHKFYIGSNSIIDYKDLNSFFKYEDYTILEKYQKSLLENIKSGNEDIVKAKLKNISEYIRGLNSINKEYFRNFYWNTISSINSIRISISNADNEKPFDKNKDISSLYKLIEKCEDLADLEGVLEEVALRVAAKVNNFNNKSLKLVLRKAVDYIQEHYKEQITLNEVAENVYVSTYYISRMFKKEMGKNFVDYLNEIRIEKAKELLKDVRFKTYEVAEMVGIPDAHYFSKLFKKHASVTPSEYREQQK